MIERKNSFKEFAIRYILPAGDYVFILASLFLYLKFFNPYTQNYIFTWYQYASYGITLAAVFTGYSYVFNLTKNSQIGKPSLMLISVLSVGFFTAVSYFFIPYITPTLPDNRTPAFLFLLCLVFLPVTWRILYFQIFSLPILVKRVLVVGAGLKGKAFVQTFSENKLIYNRTRYKFFGFIDNAIPANTIIYNEIKVLGDYQLLSVYAKRLKIDAIILAIKNKESIESKTYNALMQCRAAGIEITYANDIMEEQTGMIQVDKRNDQYYLSYNFIAENTSRIYLLITAILNFSIGLSGTLIFVLAIPFVWLMNIIGNRGPLFYSQLRVGLNGKEFKIVKFRSMIPDAEKKIPVQFGQALKIRALRVLENFTGKHVLTSCRNF